jgi:hypothetical protein
MTMANLLRNPNLANFVHGRYFTEKNGQVGTIELPSDWEFQSTPMEPDDPEKLPQSLHRDQGFVISAGYRRWEGGFAQHNIPVQAGQRYLAKAGIQPNIGFPDATIHLDAVMWRFVVEGGGARVEQPWQQTSHSSFGNYEEPTFVFQSNITGNVSFHFRGRSAWAGNTCDLNVFVLALEPVAADFGGSGVPVLGAASTADTQPNKPAGSSGGMGATQPSQPTQPIQPVQPAQPTQPAAAPLGLQLEQALTNDDINVIVAGLRALNQVTNHPTVIAGFERLAQVLEKMRK